MSKRIILVLICLALAAAGCWFFIAPGMVERLVRENLSSLPQRCGQGEIVIDSAKADAVSFDPLSLQVEIGGIRLAGSIEGAPFTAGVEKASLDIPLRLLASLAIGLSNDPCPMLARDIELEKFGFVIKPGPVQGADLDFSFVSMAASGAALEADMLRRLLDGQTPDIIDILYALNCESLKLKDMSVTQAAGSLQLRQTAQSVQVSDWRGPSIRAAAISELLCEENGRPAMSAGFLEAEDIRLPPKSLLASVNAALTSGNTPGALYDLGDSLALQQPLWRRLRIIDQVLSLNAGQHGYISIAKGSFDWFATSPFEYGIKLTDFSLPASLLMELSGQHLYGLKTVELDMDISARTAGAEGYRHDGNIGANRLGRLAWSFNVNRELFDFGALFSAGFSNLRASYTDAGLFAMLARNVSPTPELAMMAAKVAFAQVCAGENPQNAAMREALEAFVERPGTLSVRNRHDFSLPGLVLKAGQGNLGELFELTVNQGEQTLAEQMNALRSPVK